MPWRHRSPFGSTFQVKTPCGLSFSFKISHGFAASPRLGPGRARQVCKRGTGGLLSAWRLSEEAAERAVPFLLPRCLRPGRHLPRRDREHMQRARRSQGRTRCGELECILCRSPLCLPETPPRGSFFPETGVLECRGCGRRFPLHWGIPDLRPSHGGFSAHLLDRSQDLECAGMLAERMRTDSFEGLLEYFNRTSAELLGKGRLAASGLESLRRLRKRFSSRIRKAVEDPWPRSARRIFEEARAAGIELPAHPGRAADLGCGSGIQLLALAPDFERVYGIDISLKNLVLCKKLLEERGVTNVCLIAADIRRLPLAAESVDLVTLVDVLEHVAEPAAVLRESSRVLARDGMAYLATPNRFSLWREPHTGLWGLGFLPRPVAKAYVRLRRGLPFQVHAYSLGRLRATVAPWFESWTVSSLAYAHPRGVVLRAASEIHKNLERIPVLDKAADRVMPVHELVCRKRPG